MGAKRPSSPVNNSTISGLNEGSFKKPMYVSNRLRGITTFSTLATFLMRDFLRSPLLWVNLVGVVLTHLLFFGNAPDRPAFFAVAYASTLGLAVLSTAGIFSRANHPHSYPILARQVTKSGYVATVMFVSWVVCI